MTTQKGKDLLLKVDSDGAGTYTTVAGLRARTLAFNAASVDITDQESAGRWRELLEGAGIKTARITGSGIFKDAASDETLRPTTLADTLTHPPGSVNLMALEITLSKHLLAGPLVGGKLGQD